MYDTQVLTRKDDRITPGGTEDKTPNEGQLRGDALRYIMAEGLQGVSLVFVGESGDKG